MLSINMRIFKTVLLLAAFCSNRVAQCLPIANETSIVESSNPTTSTPFNSTIDYYDQRQNGSENYRVHVDGVMLVIAPVETLLLAGVADNNKPSLPAIDSSKPPSSKPEINLKLSPMSKSAQRTGLRLANLLVPLLRRIRHE
ncbi:uncharacterized protein LOC122715119 [Apis laboriosa]|uniref:uncharacterized protein LOC102679057 n=1 Tax=Apis dorsata TaxID=7462 RepID=UPI0003DF5AFD|nr:uncharacterized protein LOC102679057 [Apis dorsata]XP_043792976.1 uncharacterized protein LOC122715119 [Apis laboriosa]